MAETFTSIDLQVKISGAWVSLWADVKFPVSGSRGLEGNGPIDLLAGPGELKFRLNNAADNSAGLIGRYSPGHTNCLSGFAPSIPVRLSFVYDGQTRIKWQGRIDTDGIRVMTGSQGERFVEVAASDWMKIASVTKLSLEQVATDRAPYTAILDVLAAMDSWDRPEATSLYGGDTQFFPTIFDVTGVDTTVLGELQKIANSTDNFIFISSGLDTGEVLTYALRNPQTTQIPVTTSLAGRLLKEDGDALLLESGDFLLLDEAQNMAFDDGDIMSPGSEFQYGKHVYTQTTTVTYPRRVDAAATTVLWKLNEAKKVAASESVTFRGSYNDPGGSGNSIRGMDFVNPVSGTDFKANASSDGSGADQTANMTMTATFGAAEAEITITNTGASDFYTGGSSANTICQIRGRGVYFDDPVRDVQLTGAARVLYGTVPITFDQKYRNAVDIGDTLSIHSSSFFLSYFAPFYSVERLKLWANRDAFNMMAFLYGEPAVKAFITESMTGLSAKPAVLVGYEFEIIDSGNVFWYPMFKTNLNDDFNF